MKYYLAPMEGITTYNFRRAYHKYYGGVEKYFTPFIANRRLSSRERNDILPEHNQGRNTVPQILTNRAEDFLDIANTLASLRHRRSQKAGLRFFKRPRRAGTVSGYHF